VTAAVQRSEREPLDDHPEETDDDRCDQQRDPESGTRSECGGDREGEVGTESEQLAVAEVEDVHHPEDERQSRRDQHVDHPDHQPVQHHLEEQPC